MVRGRCGGWLQHPTPYFPGAFDDFVDQVIPILQKRGLYRQDYQGTTLRTISAWHVLANPMFPG